MAPKQKNAKKALLIIIKTILMKILEKIAATIKILLIRRTILKASNDLLIYEITAH